MRKARRKGYLVDATDKKLLLLLSKNARMSYEDMAREIGISRPAIRRRIKSMENAGVIEGFTVVVNWDLVSEE